MIGWDALVQHALLLHLFCFSLLFDSKEEEEEQWGWLMHCCERDWHLVRQATALRGMASDMLLQVPGQMPWSPWCSAIWLSFIAIRAPHDANTGLSDFSHNGQQRPLCNHFPSPLKCIALKIFSFCIENLTQDKSLEPLNMLISWRKCTEKPRGRKKKLPTTCTKIWIRIAVCQRERKRKPSASFTLELLLVYC